MTKAMTIIPMVKLLECVSTGLFIADCPWYGKDSPEIPYINIPRTLVIAMSGAILMMQIFVVSTGFGIIFFSGIKQLIPALVIGVCLFLFGLVYFLVSGTSAINDFIEILMLLFYSIVTVLCLYKFREVMHSISSYLTELVVHKLTDDEREIMIYKQKVSQRVFLCLCFFFFFKVL